VLVSVEQDTAFAGADAEQQRELIILGLAFVLTTLFVMAGTRFIVKPLRQFATTTAQFASGDLSQRIDASSGILEVIQIQHAFNAMAQSIEERVQERTNALTYANQQLVAEIDTRKKMEAELEGYTEKLKESNRDLEQFAYAASHDLREPLRKIIKFGDLLNRQKASPDQQQMYIERMQDAASRMQAMIDNLLFYSRIDRQQNTRTEVDLTEVAKNVCSDLDALIKETGGRVDIDPLPTLEADLVQMHQLLQNLIANALRYHREGVPPVVKLMAQAGKEGVHVCVQDNGVGIAEADVERIFVIFERLHGRSDGGGAGLGLAICRKIMQRHGGKISVHSEVDQGTMFTLSFPDDIQVE
jgi:signal transduction histidine kinase